MKVVIELSGNESKQDLLATSNYLRELAGETAPVMVEKKTDLDKLADAVVEANNVRKEATPVKTVSEHIAEERAKNKASRTKKVEEPKTDVINYSIDDCKVYAMKALNAKKRPIVQEAFEHVGASSFPTLKPEMFYDFVDYIASRL